MESQAVDDLRHTPIASRVTLDGSGIKWNEKQYVFNDDIQIKDDVGPQTTMASHCVQPDLKQLPQYFN
jgi:hypothetical protein